MKGLGMGDWSLIARYLKEEASYKDLDQLSSLIETHPNLRMELDMLGREINTPKVQNQFDFNADKALNRLKKRFELEDLV